MSHVAVLVVLKMAAHESGVLTHSHLSSRAGDCSDGIWTLVCRDVLQTRGLDSRRPLPTKQLEGRSF